MSERKIKRALIAVYDKTGVADFARALVDEFGIEIISTGGTAKHLKDAGIPVTLVEEITGFPEMLDGRVKTLHPKVHAAILADRDNPEHMRQLEQHGIKPIDMVVVNLYPFEKTVADPNCKFEDAIEMIDIGGPCLLRAAAKNHQQVIPVPTQNDRATVLTEFRKYAEIPRHVRSYLAGKSYFEISRYDSVVTRYLDHEFSKGRWSFRNAQHVEGRDVLRYGENPHQASATYNLPFNKYNGPNLVDYAKGRSESSGQISLLRGGALSFNNLVDADAALALCAELTRAGDKLWHRLLAGGVKDPEKRQLPPISKQLETRRNLPHIQRPGATYFITFRLAAGKLPPEERDIVLGCATYADGTKMCLHACVVMPDHVHIILTPIDAGPDQTIQLGKILQSIKGVSAKRINELRGTQGRLWMDETWDRIIRDEKEFWQKMEYVRANPRTAGIEVEPDYQWCVYEDESAWNKPDWCAYVDLKHQLVRDTGEVFAADPSHRLIAGATKSPATSTLGSIAVALFIKHTNACGVGIAVDPSDAYCRAYFGDPNAAMGGILAVNFPVKPEFATAVMETYDRFGKAAGAGGFFVEVWVAPSFDDSAVEIIRGKKAGGPVKKWGENVRLLAVGDMALAPDPEELDYKKIAGGMLVQTRDVLGLNEDQWKVVTKRAPTESEMSDLRLAWLIAKHTKSNAISLCKDGMLIGNGAGQMSRVMSCRIATWLAKENGHAEKLKGSVAASDAFFPFRDGPDILIDSGITAIIQPGGSKRDEETIKACDERGVAMIFTGTRHFKH